MTDDQKQRVKLRWVERPSGGWEVVSEVVSGFGYIIPEERIEELRESSNIEACLTCSRWEYVSDPGYRRTVGVCHRDRGGLTEPLGVCGLYERKGGGGE